MKTDAIGLRQLVLTGIDLPKYCFSDDLQFLAPWCFLDRQLDDPRWTLLKYPTPFPTTADMKEPARYVRGLALDLIPVLARHMNEYHGANYSRRFWHILLMPWLHSLISVTYERFRRLEILIERAENFHVKLSQVADARVHSTFDHITRLAHTHEYNHYLLSEILRFFDPPGWDLEEHFLTPNFTPPKRIAPHHRSLRDVLGHNVFRPTAMLSELVYRFSPKHVYLDFPGHTSLLDHYWLNRRLEKLKPPLRTVAESCVATPHRDPEERTFPEGRYEQFLSSILFDSIPQAYTSEFRAHLEDTLREDRLLDRYRQACVGPRRFVQTKDQYRYACFTEGGGKLISAQHGCYYGTLSFHYFFELSEYRSADLFLSWGWEKYDGIDHIFGASSATLTSIRKRARKRDSAQLLFVSNYHPLYPYRLISSPCGPEKFPLLQQDRITFLKQLPSTIRARTLYKTYKNRLGSFLEKEPVGLVVDDIQFVDSDLHALVEVCRILVMDYPGTTFHMAMSADIPCILFWRKEDWLFTEQADQVFEQLRRVGILHDTPEAAAKMVASAWSSVYSWWNSPVVRKARGAFNEMFARRTGKFHNEWAEIIRNH